MRRNIILLIIGCILISSSLVTGSQQVTAKQEFAAGIRELTANLVGKVKDRKPGYIIKKNEDKLYFNRGQKAGVEIGDQFKVVRREEVLTDPLTGVVLGRVSKELAKIKVIKVKETHSLAKVDSYYTTGVLKLGDQIVPVPYRIGVLKFSVSETADELQETVHDHLFNHLQAKTNFTVVDSQQIEELTDKLKLQEVVTTSSQSLISKSLNLDLLITGEIYRDQDKLLVHARLYKRQTNTIQTEAVTTFPLDNELINYYQVQNRKQFTPYHKQLLASEMFDYQALDIAVANVDDDKNLEVVLVTEQGLKLLTYQQNDLQSDGIIDTYRRTKYDDYKVVTGYLDPNLPAQIWGENSNQLVEFNWLEGNYKKEIVPNFRRNRPKLVAQWGSKRYLITRNYQHQLEFNLVNDEQYKTDFKLELARNEGYRVAVGDVDGDSEQELLVTVYQKDNQYKIKVYNLKGNLEATLPASFGPGLAVLNANGRRLVAVHTIGEKKKVLFYQYKQERYKEVGKISDFKLPIQDLAVGNINNDQTEELFILVGNKKQSKIYIYQHLSVEE